jgi:DNA-binding NarL/FixJ family response regulator
MKGTDGMSVLILSMHADDVYIRQGLKAGAKGYLVKDTEDLDLIEGVKSVARGGSYFSPSISKVILEEYTEDGVTTAVTAAAADPQSRLTSREREVLQLVAEGNTNEEIARILSLSRNTIEAHRKHIMEKLDIHTVAELVRFALRNGIVQ